jgi:hypothetical protein
MMMDGRKESEVDISGKYHEKNRNRISISKEKKARREKGNRRDYEKDEIATSCVR